MRSQIANRMHRAFTLIEILIVVVILGILAAIVIPQFTDASEDAQEASIHSQLQTLRSQIELFRVQNPGTSFDPDGQGGASGWAQLISNDYILDAPRNPQVTNANSAFIAVAATAGNGWCWCLSGGVETVRPLDNAGVMMTVDTEGHSY